MALEEDSTEEKREQATGCEGVGMGEECTETAKPGDLATSGQASETGQEAATHVDGAADGISEQGSPHNFRGDAANGAGKHAAANGATKQQEAAAEDPSVAAARDEFAPGRDVEIVGTQMNGSIGTLEAYLDQKERWKVKFPSGVSKNFKPENLRILQAKRQKKEKKRKAKDEADVGRNAPTTDEVVAKPDKTEAANAPRATAEDTVDLSMSKIMERLHSESGRQSTVSSKDPANPFVDAQPTVEQDQVNLAGTGFANQKALADHVREMQQRLQSTTGLIEGADRFFLMHLISFNEKLMGRLRGPIKGFRYAVHPNFPQSKCFMVSYNDGSDDPFSIMACVKEIFHPSTGDKKKKRQEQGDQQRDRLAKKQRQDQETEQPQQNQGFERSRAETGLKLIHEEAIAKNSPHAERWEYPLKDEEYRCFAGRLSCPLSQDVLKDFYSKVYQGTTWTQPIDPRSNEPIPRKTAWMVAPGCTCTYRYGGVDVDPQVYPRWMNEILEAYMPLCGITDRSQWPNSCNLNLYEDGGMSVGWHADDEKLFEGRFKDIRIISVSFGQTRSFELRTTGTEEDGERLRYSMRLGNGDICTMEGLTQKHYQHRVPKEAAEGPRINLTWRWATCHKQDCPAYRPKAKA